MKYRTYIIACTAMLFQALLFTDPCTAQDKYFRYFELETNAVSESQWQKLSTDFGDHDHMHVHAACPEMKTFVIAVDAEYPKRIDDMRKEISDMTENVIKSRNITSLESVPKSERDLNCQ
jgi:hypothetical protein